MWPRTSLCVAIHVALPLACEKVSSSCLENVAQLPHQDEHQRHCIACSVPCDRSCVACFDPVCHDCSHETLCTRCVFNVDGKNNLQNDSSSPVEPDCATAEVNIVEEEQNMWRRVKRGTKPQLDVGRNSTLLLSSQREKPHFIAERLITSTVKKALSRTPRQAFLATRIRARPRDQVELDLTTEEERRLIASLRHMHPNLGHPFKSHTCKSHTCHWWQRSCSSRSATAAMDVCESQQHLGPRLPARLGTDREFGDTAAVDLFVFADYAGNQLSFLNILDLASTYGIVAVIPSKHPKIVWDQIFTHWITPFGVPRRTNEENSSASSDKGSTTWVANTCRQPPSLHSKTQPVNGTGRIWKTHARRLLDESSVKFVPEQVHRVTWLTPAVT